MGPLIEIQTVPIEIEMRTKNARLVYNNASAEVEISRDKGGLNIKSRPIKVKMDSFEAQSSVRPTAPQSIEQAAQKGKRSVYEATATYAQRGQLCLNAKLGQELITQFAAEDFDKTLIAGDPNNFGLDFIPKGGVNMEWEDGTMQIRYEMDKLNFDWKTGGVGFEFEPGDIEISVVQRPEVIIKYIGGPMYVPPSADPDYEPIDVQV